MELLPMWFKRCKMQRGCSLDYFLFIEHEESLVWGYLTDSIQEMSWTSFVTTARTVPVTRTQWPLAACLVSLPVFREQRSWLSETVQSYHGCNIFYPKFHCELNFIEMVWGWTKSHHWTHCKYTYKNLKTELPKTLDEKIPIAYVRRAFDHCLRLMNGYRVGLTGAALE